jgi:hypothetical protein
LTGFVESKRLFWSASSARYSTYECISSDGKITFRDQCAPPLHRPDRVDSPISIVRVLARSKREGHTRHRSSKKRARTAQYIDTPVERHYFADIRKDDCVFKGAGSIIGIMVETNA